MHAQQLGYGISYNEGGLVRKVRGYHGHGISFLIVVFFLLTFQ